MVVKLFGGIEGGGTKTILSFFNEKSELLWKDSTGTTNPWLLGRENEDGFSVAARRIVDLVAKGIESLKASNNNIDYDLVVVGMCLSGAGCKSINDRMTDAILNHLSDKVHKYKVYVGNDSLAALYTACSNGGLVVISGTGSKCVLVNPVKKFKDCKSFDDITCYSTGGWGNLLGDEGSAYWISQKSIKYVIDYTDNFFELEHGDEQVKELKNVIFKHFEVETLDDLLPHFYSHFKKDFIAGLTAKLATLAETNSIIQSIFEECGYQLARHIVAIEPRLDEELLNLPGGLPIVCAGSVFKSWPLIRSGFIKCLEAFKNKKFRLKELKLVTIKEDSTIGAALLASHLFHEDSEFGKNVDVSKLFDILDHVVIHNKHNSTDNAQVMPKKLLDQLIEPLKEA